MSTENFEKLMGILSENLTSLRKIVFSKPKDSGTKKCEVLPIMLKGERNFALTTYTSDNKSIRKNILPSEALPLFAKMALEDFGQTNIFTGESECSVMVSKKGKVTFIGSLKGREEEYIPLSHNREKNYIIDSREHSAFLAALGVCDEKGNVFDKKRAKYRQINRFVELLDDVYDKLPKDPCKQLTVCDLCCGKSYLTFAVYYYLTALKGRTVKMFGVDLKADVINHCQALANKLSCKGLTFICGDIMDFKTESAPDLVISLHACDVATDIVLAYAMKNRARLILSTPCCHHEMFWQMKSSSLEFIEKHSILKQKFCDAATDALRTLYLESEGYKAEAIELIDPEETPKNVMIRAYLSDKIQPGKKKIAHDSYISACLMLGIQPTLQKLMEK